jgi:hypothetical protein
LYMLSYFHDGRCHAQTCIHTNRLLVAHDAGATATVISFRLPLLAEPSAPANSLAYRVPPQPSMVAHFPTQSIRSTGLHLVRWNGPHIELHQLHSEGLHSEQSCFCQKNGKLAALPAPAPCKLDPSVRVLPSLRSTLTEETLLNYTPRPRTRGSPLFALCTATPRRCSHFSLTSLDPLDRVVATLLDEF